MENVTTPKLIQIKQNAARAAQGVLARMSMESKELVLVELLSALYIKGYADAVKYIERGV